MSRSKVQRIVVTIDEAAEMLALDPRTVQRMIADGTLRSIKIRGARRIPVTAIRSLLADA